MTDSPLIDRLIDLRTADPAGFSARVRNRRPADWAPNQPLMVIAADHPARGAFRAGTDPLAMADRERLLNHCLLALDRPGVNGFLGTADLIDDLANLGALDGKVVFGSMNRGGQAGACFELDDRMTGYDASGVAAHRLTGGKMLLRIDPGDPASVTTLAACGQAVDQLARRHRIAMVEPFISRRGAEGHLSNDLSAQAVVRSVAVAAGLGSTSAWTWLKLPAIAEMDQVARASSLPILILGGEVADDPDTVRRLWGRALVPRTVRGLTLGRSVLFPADGDVERAVDAAVGLLAARN